MIATLPSQEYSHEVRVVADSRDEVPEENETNNSREPISIVILDCLLVVFEDIHEYNVVGERFDIAARVYYASTPDTPLTPDYGVICHVSIAREGVGTVVDHQVLSFDPAGAVFHYIFDPGGEGIGEYSFTLDVETPEYRVSETREFVYLDEILSSVGTDRALYLRGDPVEISGNFTFSDGSPIAGKIVYISLRRGFSFSVRLTYLVIPENEDKAYIKGECTFRGERGYTFFLEIEDKGRHRHSSDTIHIVVKDSLGNIVYEAEGTLAAGVIAIRRRRRR